MIFWACPACQAKLRAPETAIGRKLPCPKCQAITVVPPESSVTNKGPAAEARPKENTQTASSKIEAPEAPNLPEASVSGGLPRWLLGLVAAGVLASAAIAGTLFVFNPFQKEEDQTRVSSSQANSASNEIANAAAAKPIVSPSEPTTPAAAQNSKPQAGESSPAPAPLIIASETITLVGGVEKKQIEAKVTFADPNENPFVGTLELKRGQFAPDGPFTFRAEVGDCVRGYVLTEPVELTWSPADGPTKVIPMKVFHYNGAQLSMAQTGRTMRAGAWKSDPLGQLILRNQELRNAGDAVWQLAFTMTSSGGSYPGHRNQFANSPYDVTQAQWEFTQQIMNRLRSVAEQMANQETQKNKNAVAASAVRIPFVQAIREERIQPTFRFPTLLKSSLAIEFKVAPGVENRRLEMWAPEAMRTVVEVKPGQLATYYVCELELSTAKAKQQLHTDAYNWNGIAFSAAPVEPEPIVENTLYELTTGAKKPQFGEVDPIVAHIASQSNLDVVKKQLAIWVYNNPALSADAIHALGRKFDDPILSTIPESVLEDARLQVRSSRWQVEQLPVELQQGKVMEFFVGEWKPAEYLQAREAAVNFQLPSSLANPLLPQSEIENLRRQLTLGYGGIDIEPITMKLFPDLHFEASGAHLGRPVETRGNWRWTGSGLEFPLWMDGKGNDPFLVTGGRANLPMLLLADKQVIGQAVRPSSNPKPHGVFLRKFSNDPSTMIAASVPGAPADTSPSGDQRTPDTQGDGALNDALKNVELQTQAAAIDLKNTRVCLLMRAVTEGLVTLDIEVVEPKLKQEFMHKEARLKIKKTPAAERLNLKLLCAAPMQFEMKEGRGNPVQIVLASSRAEAVEISAIQAEIEIQTRCFAYKWEGLNEIMPLQKGIPQTPDAKIAFLAATQGGAYLHGGDAEIRDFYAVNWKKILALREKEEKVMKSSGLDSATIQKDRERWLANKYYFDEIDVLGRTVTHQVSSPREISTAILYLLHPDWKAEQLLRYAHSKEVRASLSSNGQEYLMEQFAPMPSEALAMKGHMPNFLGFLLAKFAKEQVGKYPQPLQNITHAADVGSYFQGRWKSVSKEKALEVFNQLTPRTAEEYEAKSEQMQYMAEGEPFSVGVLPISVSLLTDNISDLRRQRDGAELQEAGFWQWDGSQLWIGKTPYHVVGEHLVNLKSDPGHIYGSILERDATMNLADATVDKAIIEKALTGDANTEEGLGENAHSDNAIAEQSPAKRAGTDTSPMWPPTSSQDEEKKSSAKSEPTTEARKDSLKSLTAEAVVGEWKPASKDRAVLVRAAVMRRMVDSTFGIDEEKLPPDLKARQDQLRSMALTEAAKNLRVPEIEFTIEKDKTFRFKSKIKGAEEEFSGKWSIKDKKLVLVKDKFVSFTFELLEGALYSESIQYGEVYVAR